MPKLKLQVDALRVESFTVAAHAGRGTVRAESDPLPVPQLSECGADCMSGDSWCPIMSCGSGCDTETREVAREPTRLTDG